MTPDKLSPGLGPPTGPKHVILQKPETYTIQIAWKLDLPVHAQGCVLGRKPLSGGRNKAPGSTLPSSLVLSLSLHPESKDPSLPPPPGWRHQNQDTGFKAGRRKKKELLGNFPGSPVVKNLPSSVGNTGSIPCLGTKIPQAPGQQSPRPHQRSLCKEPKSPQSQNLKCN